MKYKILTLFLALFLIFFPTLTSITADEAQDSPPEQIDEEETPKSPRRERNEYMLFYFSGALTIVVVGFVYLKLKNKNNLVLNVDNIEENDDGSFTVYLGYESNSNEPIKMSDSDFGIKVLKGNAIMLKNKNTSFTKGKHENEIIAVVNEQTELEFYVKDQKILIKGKDLKKGGY